MSASERRHQVRTGVVWSAVRDLLASTGHGDDDAAPARIVDIGGGTGGFAVPLAVLGHRVEVVDPSPDALAALDRRAHEEGVADRVTGRQGYLADVAGILEEADLVLCHGVLEVVDDPAEALAVLTGALRPGGHLSLLVAGRHAAVLARAMAGHFHQALDLLEGSLAPSAGVAPGSRRFTHDELLALATGAGLEPVGLRAVRVFADLVPGALLDSEPGATAALVELERAVSERPEYFALANQLHLLARR